MVSAAQQSLIQGALTPAAVANQVATFVAAKALQAQRQEGDGILKLLDSAASGGASPGDALVAKARGLGGLLDVVG